MCVIYKDLLQMLVDPLSNFYLYYSLEKTMVLLFQNRYRLVKPVGTVRGCSYGIQAYENCKLV